MDERHEVKLPFYARLAAILLCVALITEIMSHGRAIIIPLFFSVLISLMLLPLTKLLERWRLQFSWQVLYEVWSAERSVRNATRMALNVCLKWN